MTDVYAWRKIGDFFSSEDIGKTISDLGHNNYLMTNKVQIAGEDGVSLKCGGGSSNFVCVEDIDGIPTGKTSSTVYPFILQYNTSIIPKNYLDQKIVYEVKNTKSLSNLLDVNDIPTNIGQYQTDYVKTAFIYSYYEETYYKHTASYIFLCKALVDGAYSPVIAYAELNDDATSMSDYTIKTFVPSSTLAAKLISGEWVQIEFSAHDGGAFLGQEKWAVNTLKIDGQTAFSNVRLKTNLWGTQSYGTDPTYAWERGFFLYSNSFSNESFNGIKLMSNQLRNYSAWIMYKTTPRSPTITIQKSGTTTIQLTAVVDTDPSISEAVSYLWSTGETSASITLNVPNDNDIHRYTCTATDSAGQSVTGEYTIYNPSIEFYSLLWNTGETAEIIYPQENGTYTCTVTNGGGSATASIEVTEIEGLFQFNYYPLQSSYSQQNTPNIIRTQMMDGHARQRRMFESSKKPAQVNCRYLMTDDDLAFWISKWRDRLCEGSEWFLARLLADDSYTGYKEVRLLNGEFEYSLQSHTEERDLYYVDMKLEVRSA